MEPVFNPLIASFSPFPSSNTYLPSVRVTSVLLLSGETMKTMSSYGFPSGSFISIVNSNFLSSSGLTSFTTVFEISMSRLIGFVTINPFSTSGSSLTCGSYFSNTFLPVTGRLVKPNHVKSSSILYSYFLPVNQSYIGWSLNVTGIQPLFFSTF